MSSRPKALLKQAKSKHKKEQKLETADDYQAAGVDFEDAAGKWRAGDAAKSLRFFQRALEIYEVGLQKFPQSLDLAYNKARVELEMATHPILVKQLQQPLMTVLRSALKSHRYALNLDQDNTDTLFNAAQVLTSIAEEIAKNDVYPDAEALPLLEEALEIQTRCLGLQELKYEESLEQRQEAAQQAGVVLEGVDVDDEDGGVSLASAQNEDQWFSIVEPVTKDTLIDTTLAQLGTLTTFCGILSNSHGAPATMLAWVEEYSAKVLSDKLPFLARDYEERISEIALAKANFISTLLEAGFRTGRLDATTYKRERDAAFSTSELGLEKSVEALLANARSLMSYSTALFDSVLAHPSTLPTSQWNALSAALTNLITASKISGIASDDLAKTHFLRGDCSMLQRQMALPPVEYQSAMTNASQLLKNAEVFYRNASKLSSDPEDKAAAGLRSGIAQYLQQGDKTTLNSAIHGRNEAWFKTQIQDMFDEGLVPPGFQVQ